MSDKRTVLFSFTAALIFFLFATLSSAQVKVQVVQFGTGSLSSGAPGNEAVGNPEIDPASVGDDDSDSPLSSGKVVNRTIAKVIGNGPTTSGNAKAKSNP